MELLPEQYNQVIKLLDSDNYAPVFSYSVLYRTLPGAVHVDTLEQPSIVMIYANNGSYYISGDVTSFATSVVKAELSLHIEKSIKNSKRFVLFASEDWEEAIAEHLPELCNKIHRYSYNFNEEWSGFSSSPHTLIKPREGGHYVFGQVTSATIHSSPFYNKEYYYKFWLGTTRFLEHGFGFCVTHEKKIIGECVAIAANSVCAELDIEISEDYQGQGLGVQLASFFIQQCLVQGIKPRWECNIGNMGSIKTAAKLGFHNPVQYQIYFL